MSPQRINQRYFTLFFMGGALQASFRLICKHFPFYRWNDERQHQIKMTEYIKNRHTAIFTGWTSCRNSHLVLNFIGKEYSQHHDYIIIICPTLRWNKSYHAKRWIKYDGKVWLTISEKLCITLFILHFSPYST